MKLPKVYIAGPYSRGDVADNVRTAIEAANEINQMGAVPYVPHLTHFWDLMTPKSYKWWLWYDLQWLVTCDMLVRLPGLSKGADQEVEEAKCLGMLVFYGLEELRAALE